mgnify:CR=1 FL=1
MSDNLKILLCMGSAAAPVPDSTSWVDNIFGSLKMLGHDVSLINFDDVISHSKSMDELKQSVQGAVYEQKDPLLIYKFESFNLFSSLLEEVNRDALSFLFKANLPQRDPKNLKNIPTQRRIEGKASRGQEEVLNPARRPGQNRQDQPQISRRQRRAQERKMRRG